MSGAEDGMIVIDTPQGIQAFRLLSLHGSLHLETLGMTRRGTSAFAQVKQEFGFKGSKLRVYEQYCQMLRERGILHDGE